jgi:hypothetical protein
MMHTDADLIGRRKHLMQHSLIAGLHLTGAGLSRILSQKRESKDLLKMCP